MIYEIPLFDLNYGREEEESLIQTVRSKWISTGPKCAEFESMFAGMLGCKHAVSLSSGTGALHLALRALDVSESDEVIVPSFTFVATVNVILYAGATPVFCDIKSPDDPTIDARQIEELITPRTKVILVMHYGGFPCNMASIMDLARQRKLAVVEDACHAPASEYEGKKLGTIGDIGCFSFYANKNLTTGEGGMLVTNDEEIHRRTKLLRSHCMTSMSYERAIGRSMTYEVADLGFNFRMDDLRASLGIAQLKKLATDLRRRAEIRDLYLEHLADVEEVLAPFAAHSGFVSNYIFPIVLKDSSGSSREQIREQLKAAGIQTSVHFPPVHRFSFYRKFAARLPKTDFVADHEITLPMYANLDETLVVRVVDALKSALCT